MLHIKRLLVIAICLLNVSCGLSYHKVDSFPEYVDHNNSQEIRVALVLSGAGSKAIAHAGVISALEKHNIPIDLIVGSSAGSLVGLFYADSKDIQKVKNLFLNTTRTTLLEHSATYAFVSSVVFNTAEKLNKFEKFLESNIKAKNFEDLQIPLAVTGTNIMSGHRVLYNSGPVIPAVLSSSSIPGIFEPVKISGNIVVDGAVASPVPVMQARMFNPRTIIAVNATSGSDSRDIIASADLLYRAYAISYFELAKLETSLADIAIIPELDKYDWLEDFTPEVKEDIFQAGFDATEKIIHDIKLKVYKQ
ncbi:MAG: patatin-like phospholipase family protein [Alphaproteobacteria bacterium]|nr:patatin-like phospholipase family protein [Alphaproteobacteria bacterium]